METYTKWIAEQYVLTGEKYQRKLKFDEAIKLYSDAIIISKENPDYFGQRALCKYHIFDYESALSDARHATDLDGNYQNGYILQAKCAIALGDTVTAERALNSFVDLFPANEPDVREEIVQVKKLNSIWKDYNKAFDAKAFSACLYLVEEAIEISPGSTKFQLSRAECMLWRKCYAEAENIVQKVLLADNLNAEAHMILGLIYYHKDMIEDALSKFQRTLEIDSDHMDAQEMVLLVKSIMSEDDKANQYIGRGKYDAALLVYQRLLQLDLKHNPAMTCKIYYNCALMNFNLKNYLESISDSCKALERNPAHFNALLNRAQCYFNLSNFNEAIRDCLAAYEVQQSEEVKTLYIEANNEAGVKLRKEKQKNAETYIIIGNRFHREKNYIEAVNKYSQAIQHSPETVEFYDYRIASLMMLGDVEVALKDFARLSLLADLSDNQIITKAKCLIMKGDLKGAETMLNEIDEDSTNCDYDVDMLHDLIHKIHQLNDNIANRNYEACNILLDIISDDYNQMIPNAFKLIRAECLSSKGRQDEALKLLDEITPIDSRVRHLKGSILYAKGCLVDAVVNLEQCLESDSGNEQAAFLLDTVKELKGKFELGSNLLRLEQYEEANQVFDEIEKSLGGANKHILTSLAFKRATCFLKLSNYGECIKYCNLVADGSDVKTEVYSMCELAKKKLTEPIQRSKVNRKNADRDFQKGVDLHNDEVFKPAIKKFSEAIADCPKVSEYYLKRAECYMKISDYPAALADAKIAISLDANTIEGYLIAAKCYIVTGDIIEVRSIIDNLEKLNARNPVDDLNAIIEEYKKWEKSIQNAITYFDNKNFKMCIENINDVIEITPTPLKFQLIKAECFVLLGEYYKAQMLYESIGETNDYKYVTGLIYYYENNFDRALSNFQKYLDHNDENINAKRVVQFIEGIRVRREEGLKLMDKEYYDEALAMFTEALSIDESCSKVNSELYLKCAVCNWKLGFREECVQDCNTALKLLPTFIEAMNVRDDCQKEIDQIAYEKKIANDATIQNRIADDHRHDGEYEKAIVYYTRAIEIMPNIASYYANRTMCYLMIGDFEAALADARQATQLDRTFIDGYIWEVKCLILLGDTECDVNILPRLRQLDLYDNLRLEQKKEVMELQKIRLSFISASSCYKSADYENCIKHINKAFEKSMQSNYYKQMRAECLIRLYRINEASDNISQITPSNSVEVLRLRCLLNYYDDNFEDVVDISTSSAYLFKDPEIKRIIMTSKKISSLMNQEHSVIDSLLPNNKDNDKNLLKLLNSEITKYTIKGNSADIRMKLYYQRAQVNYRLCRMDDALRDCADALAISPKYVNVLRTRAKWFYEAKRFGECTRDCKTLFAIEKTNAIRQLSGGIENMQNSPRSKSMSPQKSFEY